MLPNLWKKFVLLSGTSGMTASTCQPRGIIRDDDDMRAFFYKLMHETMAVGRGGPTDPDGGRGPGRASGELFRKRLSLPWIRSCVGSEVPLGVEWMYDAAKLEGKPDIRDAVHHRRPISERSVEPATGPFAPRPRTPVLGRGGVPKGLR
jgi:hypothetical protein